MRISKNTGPKDKGSRLMSKVANYTYTGSNLVVLHGTPIFGKALHTAGFKPVSSDYSRGSFQYPSFMAAAAISSSPISGSPRYRSFDGRYGDYSHSSAL